MDSSATNPKPGLFNIRLSSGQILKSLYLADVAKRVADGTLRGEEVARVGSGGAWLPIKSIPELGELFVTNG